MKATTGLATPSDRSAAITQRPLARSVIRVGVIGGRKSRSKIVDRLLRQTEGCHCEHMHLKGENDFGALKAFDVVVWVDEELRAAPGGAPEGQCRSQLELLRRRHLGTLIFTNRPYNYVDFDAGMVCLPPDCSLDLARGALMALAHMRPMIRRFDEQFSAMQRLGRNLRQQCDATDRDLQLASHLQREFLPRDLPGRGPIRFHTMFRPCSWVSGDLFDVFRLDEKHWGFYLADAVGHGVAAGLMTMYIKHAIRPKRIYEDGYELVPPSEVLQQLNDQLIAQQLPDSQFITGWYGVFNTETFVLKYAVAGHPPPLLIGPDGRIRELHGDGCLLGLSEGESFSDESVALQPGHRVMIYSDGLESTLIAHRPPMPELPTFGAGIEALLRAPAAELLRGLRERLDATPGSLNHADDVSMLVLDVASADQDVS